jgi:hypothetical protein
LFLICAPATSSAATRVVEPAADPFHIELDGKGAPRPFTIRVSGFVPGAQVYAEQCDGRDPSDRAWTPVRDCDAHAFPQPEVVGADGIATFRAVRVFNGASPQGLFNCLRPGAPSPHNGLADYDTCRVRVSSNIAFATPDQVFFRVVLGSGTSGSSHWWVVVGAVVLLGAIGVVVILARRRGAA